MKSSVEQIRERFDGYVDRFSDLNVGQRTAIDSPICLELIAQSAAAMNAGATAMLDIGCGAGNWTLKLLERLPKLECTLLDLSRPMLDRAKERVSAAGATRVECVQGDVRQAQFANTSFDLIVAGAVFHHLRAEDEWKQVAALLYRWLRPDGSVWVYDMVAHELPAVESVMQARYADYLKSVGGDEFAKSVFAYIEQEDTPWPVHFQMQRLIDAGFTAVDLLHKNGPFAAYVARK